MTGANKGIGKATVAAILGAADDTMVLLGSRDLGRGEAAVADILAEQPAFKGVIYRTPNVIATLYSVHRVGGHGGVT